MKMLILVLLSIVSVSASAANYCNTDGVVEKGTSVYTRSGNKFYRTTSVYRASYYAKVLKRATGEALSASQGSVLAKSHDFVLIAVATANSCVDDISWVSVENFTSIP